MTLHTDHRALVAAAGAGFLVLSLIIAVMPALDLQQTAAQPGSVAPGANVLRGRELYVREGCGFCHTQFVRDLPVDRPYGRGSVAADYVRESPPMLGTQRTGPDLANVGSRQSSETWHLIHLYNPRAVAPNSVMPAYPWYFEIKANTNDGDLVVPVPPEHAPVGGVVVATDDAIEIVRYLQSLVQAEVSE